MFIRVVQFSLLVVVMTISFTPAFSDTGIVLTGIDVLQRNGFRALAGRNIGLITNHTGIDRSGISNIQLLHDASEVNLVVLFSPEHGLFGKLDVPLIDDAEDLSTGIRVFSLYGNTRVPTSDMLKNIDTLVFDIQDIGTRFYTYISTMGHAMQAAADKGKRFVVLDRPNPINGITVAGPMLDEGRQSFTGFHRLPVRHGMTIGELALMFKAELQLDIEALPGGQVRLSWPESADHQALESSSDLGASDTWAIVGATPVLNDGSWEVTLSKAQARQFFRLRRKLE